MPTNVDKINAIAKHKKKEEVAFEGATDDVLIKPEVSFDIDGDNLEVYVNGWYLGDIPLAHLSAEARYEIGLDMNYNDEQNCGGKDIRPDRSYFDLKL